MFVRRLLSAHCEVDIGFMIDGSASLGPKKFEILMGFVKSIISALIVSKKEARVGAVVFGSKPQPVFGFDEEKSTSEALNALDKVK